MAGAARRTGEYERFVSVSRHPDSFYLRRDGLYLQWSAKKLTTARTEAWKGTERQGLNCIVKFPAAKGCLLFADE